MERFENQLLGKAILSTSLQINCFNFGLNIWVRRRVAKIVKKNYVWKGLEQVISEKLFAETIICKILTQVTNSR